MTGKSQNIPEQMAGWIQRYRSLVLPTAAALLIFVILVPLPPSAVDILLVGNIAMAAIILLTTIYVESPLEFSVFPSVLLGATLGRLVLNVATTRLILSAGLDGRTSLDATRAAGKVIWSFSSFVTSGSLAIGVILFLILVVVQFVVITKGASRISEVAARFVLDAMPGKQVSIDADLKAGLIDKNQARAQRKKITSEADFYGAMDGASKFIRGEALAGLIITMINIFGGLYVGMVQYGWSLNYTAELFTRLTIGDGLVTQIPAFLISVSAALLVSRSTARTNLGEEVVVQLTGKPVVLGITAMFMAALMLTELPKIPLVLLMAGCAGLAMAAGRKKESCDAHCDELEAGGESSVLLSSLSVDEVVGVEPIRIDLGYSLVRLVDVQQGGNLLGRISQLRKRIAMQLGLVLPPVTVRDDMELGGNNFIIRIRGLAAAQSRIFPGKFLAVSGENAPRKLIGLEVDEPLFKSKAVWITAAQKTQALEAGYTVVEPAVVMMMQLTQVIYRNSDKLLSREQVTAMLTSLAKKSASIVEDAKTKFPLHIIHKVMQNLLSEQVSIRDLESILEAMCEADDIQCGTAELTEHVRSKLSAVLSQQYSDPSGTLYCVRFNCDREFGADGLPPKPDEGKYIAQQVGDAISRMVKGGKQPVVLCPPRVRSSLKQMLSIDYPEAAVLGYNEVQSVKIKSLENVEVTI